VLNDKLLVLVTLDTLHLVVLLMRALGFLEVLREVKLDFLATIVVFVHLANSLLFIIV